MGVSLHSARLSDDKVDDNKLKLLVNGDDRRMLDMLFWYGLVTEFKRNEHGTPLPTVGNGFNG